MWIFKPGATVEINDRDHMIRSVHTAVGHMARKQGKPDIPE